MASHTIRHPIVPRQPALDYCDTCGDRIVWVEPEYDRSPHWRHKPQVYQWGDKVRHLRVALSEIAVLSTEASIQTIAHKALTNEYRAVLREHTVHLTGDERWRNRDGKTITVLTGDERLRAAAQAYVDNEDVRLAMWNAYADCGHPEDSWCAERAALAAPDPTHDLMFALRAALTETERPEPGDGNASQDGPQPPAWWLADNEGDES